MRAKSVGGQEGAEAAKGGSYSNRFKWLSIVVGFLLSLVAITEVVTATKLTVNGTPDTYYGRPGQVVVVEWEFCNYTKEVQDVPHFSFSNSAGWEQRIPTGYVGPGRHVDPKSCVKVAVGIKIPKDAKGGDSTTVTMTYGDPLTSTKRVVVRVERAPTLTPWGLIGLGVFLAGSLAWMIRRRVITRPSRA